MRRAVLVAFAVMASVLVMSAGAGAAPAAPSLAVGSEHTTTSDFQGGQTLDNFTASGDTLVGKALVKYNPVDDDGDGDSDSSLTQIGEGGGSTQYNLSIEMVPTESGEVTQLSYTIASASGDPSGMEFAIYMSAGSTDGSWGEGTKVVNDWTPVFSQGTHTVELDSSFSVTAGNTYEVELLTVSGPGGSGDNAQLASDSSASTTKSTTFFGGEQEYGDVTLNIETGTFDTANYVSSNHSTTGSQAGWLNITEATDATATVTWEGWTGSTWTTLNQTSGVSTAANHSFTWSQFSGDKVRVDVDVNGDTSGSPAFNISDGGVLFENDAPTASNLDPPGGTDLSGSNVDFSVEVNDSQFGTSQGDSVTAELFVDGSSVGSKTVTSNGTVTISHTLSTGGSHNYKWVLTDSYGGTTDTGNQTVRVPATLGIYYEGDPERKITDENISLSVRFYELDGGDVVKREADNGTVNLTGLPVGSERFIVTVNANQTDQLTYRRIIIDTVYQTQRIYLLNESRPHSQIVFELNDPTGQFPPSETILYVERALERNNTTRYEVIAGDTFGTTARFPIILQDDERYRLRAVSTTTGNERILGAYSVYEPTTEQLRIERIEPSANVDGGQAIYGDLETFNGSDALVVRYRDLGESASSVTYKIVAENGTTVVSNTTSTADTFAHTYPINNTTQSYSVEYEINLDDGSTRAGSFTIGKVSGLADRFNIDPQVASIISWSAILATMGLLVIVDAKIAPLGGVGMATALSILGTVAIPPAMLGVAGGVSVLALVGGGQQ